MSVHVQQDILERIAKLRLAVVLHVKMVELALTKLTELMYVPVLPDTLERIAKLIHVPVHLVKMVVHVLLIHLVLQQSTFAHVSMVTSALIVKMSHVARIYV